MQPSRHRLIMLVCLFGIIAALGCSSAKVGEPCLPEQIPDDGFNSAETYIETSSVQCESRVCIVHQFQGHPDNVADEEVLKERIHCSCRCAAPSADFDECDCPAGYTCKEVLEEGGPGNQGGYCINVKTASD